MRKKRVHSINLFSDQAEEIKNQGLEISSYIRELIDRDTDSLEKQKEKLKELESETKKLRKNINQKEKEKQQKREQIENVSEKEKEHHLRTLEIVEEKGYFYMQGRRKAFNNDFGKNLNKKEYEELLSDINKRYNKNE